MITHGCQLVTDDRKLEMLWLVWMAPFSSQVLLPTLSFQKRLQSEKSPGKDCIIRNYFLIKSEIYNEPLEDNWKWKKVNWILTSIYSMFRYLCFYLVCFWHNSPQWASASSFTRFLDHKQRRTTVAKTPLDEWSARRRDLYLTKHNTHIRQTFMSPVGFEPTVSAGERSQTSALDRPATGTGI